jgi:hypothetical protein
LSKEPGVSHSHTSEGNFINQLLSAAKELQPPLIDTVHRAAEAWLTGEGHNRAENLNNRATAFIPPAYDPTALLNPKAPVKRPATDPSNSQDDASECGQISLVERLHNVHQRTASPAKRARTDSDHQQKQPPKSSIQGGSTLDLQRENNPPASIRPEASTIDLTMSECNSILHLPCTLTNLAGDEEDARNGHQEDVTVVGDNGHKIICIGRVKQVYVQSHVVPFPDPHKYRGNHGQQGRIKVSFRRGGMQKTTNIIMVVDPTNKEFGRIDIKTAQGLAPLMDSAKQNGLQWIAVTEARKKQPGEGPPGSPLSTLIGLTLQLYCPRRIAHDIGRYLKTKNVYLGDPIIELGRHDYFNPQTRQYFSAAEAGQPQFQTNYGRGANYGGVANIVVRTVEEIRGDVLNLFDEVVNPEQLPQRKQSDLIRTRLLKHQEQALHFMVDREAEWTDDKDTRKSSLYKVNISRDGRQSYVHVITGEEFRKKPESTRGGILADEMGLGKTLSILALLVDDASRSAAQAFAEKAPPLSPNNIRHQVVNSRATLLLCPLSTMVNWKTQIHEHLAPGIKWVYYHGADRKRFSPHDLADHDLVITTYHMVAADAFDTSKPLNRINWFRIVLDEAHQIRSGRSKQALGVYELASQRRWAVTGTPVQNRLDDLHALFKFLRVKPFNEAAGFNTYILGPFKAADPEVVPKLQLLVGSLTLRRLKEGNIILPLRTDQIVRLQFSDDERRLHEWFEQYSAKQVNAVTSGDKLGGGAYARILKAILNLRLVCAHGRDLLGDDALALTEGMTSENPVELDDEDQVVENPALTRKAAYEMLEVLDQTDSDKCQFFQCRNHICGSVDDGSEESDSDDDDSESPEQPQKSDLIGYMTPCYHLICPRHSKDLGPEWALDAKEREHIVCQFCDTWIRPVLFELRRSDWGAFQEEREHLRRDPKLAKKAGAYNGPHTKTRALLEELHKNDEESRANPDSPPIKRYDCAPLANKLFVCY